MPNAFFTTKSNENVMKVTKKCQMFESMSNGSIRSIEIEAVVLVQRK